MGVGTAISAGLGGASLLGGLMGGGGGKGGKGGSSGGGGNVTIAPSPYETQLAQMSQEYYQKTSPLRDVFLQDYMGFLRPGGTSYSSYYAPSGGTTTTGGTGAATSPASSPVPSQGDIYKTLFGSTFGGTNIQGLRNLGLTDAEIVDITNNYGAAGGLVPGSIGQLDSGAQQWLTNKSQEIRSNMLSNQIASGQQAQATQQTGTQGQGGQTIMSSGAYNPYALPAYQPLYQLARQGIESQFGPAREAIMASTPRGGALAESLANLEMGRAQQAGSLPATIAAPLIEDIVNKAYGVAFNAPQTSMAGLSGASAGYAGRFGSTLGANAAANQLGALQSASTAKGLGSLAALGMGGISGKNPFKGATATGGVTMS